MQGIVSNGWREVSSRVAGMIVGEDRPDGRHMRLEGQAIPGLQVHVLIAVDPTVHRHGLAGTEFHVAAVVIREVKYWDGREVNLALERGRRFLHGIRVQGIRGDLKGGHASHEPGVNGREIRMGPVDQLVHPHLIDGARSIVELVILEKRCFRSRRDVGRIGSEVGIDCRLAIGLKIGSHSGNDLFRGSFGHIGPAVVKIASRREPGVGRTPRECTAKNQQANPGEEQGEDQGVAPTGHASR